MFDRAPLHRRPVRSLRRILHRLDGRGVRVTYRGNIAADVGVMLVLLIYLLIIISALDPERKNETPEFGVALGWHSPGPKGLGQL